MQNGSGYATAGAADGTFMRASRRPEQHRYARQDPMCDPTSRRYRLMTRSALVTGGNRGIGLAIARRLAAGGDAVTVTSRSGEEGDGLTVARCDVRDAAGGDRGFAPAQKEHGPAAWPGGH